MNIILITGAARSGTSMIAGIIDKCGAFGGVTSGPNPNNKKGMFENIHIRNHITKPYLRSMGLDPRGQFPLPDVRKLRRMPALRDDVLCTFIREGWNEVSPIYYKGAKMCLLWPIWHKAFPEAKWIIVRRPDKQIVQSCLRTSFMNTYYTGGGWQGWLDFHKERFKEMKENGLDIMEVWSDEIVKNPGHARYFINWLELPFDLEEVTRFVDPSLYGQTQEHP